MATEVLAMEITAEKMQVIVDGELNMMMRGEELEIQQQVRELRRKALEGKFGLLNVKAEYSNGYLFQQVKEWIVENETDKELAGRAVMWVLLGGGSDSGKVFMAQVSEHLDGEWQMTFGNDEEVGMVIAMVGDWLVREAITLRMGELAPNQLD